MQFVVNLTMNDFIGMAILQNGKFPTFMERDTVQWIFWEEDSSPAIVGLRNGLDKVGIEKVRLNYFEIS